MKNFIKKSIWGYNFFDLILVVAGLASVITTSIIFNSSWLIIINSILGIFCVFTQAKGKVATQFIGVVWFSFYVFLSYQNQYYGEVLINLFILIPLYIYGIIHWLAHRDKTENVVIVRNNLSKREWIIAGLAWLFVSVGIYFLLEALNTSQVFVSTIAFDTMLASVYLLVRRVKWNQVSFLVNDFITPILWLVLVLNGNALFIPLIVYHIFQAIYDAYGLYVWTKLEKEQKAKGIK